MDFLTLMILFGFLIALEVGYTVYHFYNKHKKQVALYKNWGDLSEGDFSLNEMNFIKEQTKQHYESFLIDDITWNDLDMDVLYQRMNKCFSAAGDQALYHFLRNPEIDPDKIDQHYQVIQWALKDEQGRNLVRSALAKIESRGLIAIDSLYKESNSIKILSKPLTYLFAFFPVAILIACIFDPYLFVFAVIVCIVNAFLSNTYRKSMADDFESALYLYGYARSIQALSKTTIEATILQHYDILTISKKLSSLKRSLLPDMREGDDLFSLILSNCFLGEILSFYRLKDHLIKHQETILQAIRVLGELDALIAIASFMHSQNSLCKATFIQEHTMMASQMIHPLLKNPVPNDVDLQSNILISGSNASGKSTYLKMIAINCILAQSFGFALSKTYESGIFQVYTSMSLKDSIENNDSYFVAEIKSIKRIIDHTQDDIPILCMIDEILRGTNTTERIAASSEVLLTLSNAGAICLAATHDLELTHILENHYHNVHFTENFQDEQMQFDYHIHEGVSNSKNALSLLSTLAFDKQVVKEAEEQLQYYEQHNTWKLIRTEVKDHEK